MGAGQKTRMGWYLTSLTEVRTVLAADADVDSVDEIVHMGQDESGNPAVHGTGTLFVYVCAESEVTGYTFKLYAKPALSEPSSSSSGNPSCGWFLVEVTAETSPEEAMAFGFRDLPAVDYKIVVSSITGSGALTIYEQHTV